MPIYLRQSTASQEIPLGYFVDSTDGNTEETGLTIANTDIKVWKTGATTLANKNSGGATHISNGIYYAVLDATDTDTIGPLVVFVHVSGALTVRVECCVLDEAVYDVMFGTTAPATATNITAATGVDVTKFGGAAGTFSGGRPEVNTTHAAGTAWGSGAITAASIASDAITAAKIATGAVDADALAADAVAEIADGVFDEATAGHVAAGSFGKLLADVLEDTGTTLQAEVDGIQADTEDIQTRLPAALTAGGNIKADVLAISGDATAADNLEAALDGTGAVTITAGLTGNITGNLSGSVGSVTGAVGSVTGNVGGNVTGSVGSLAAQAKADVNAEVDTALVDVRLDELIAADSDIDGAAPPTVGSVVHELMSKTAGSFTYDQTTDSLEAIRDKETDIETDTQDIQTKIGTPAGASVSADIADVEGKVDDLETRLGTPSDLGSGATVAANLVDIEGQTDSLPEFPAKNAAFTYTILMVASSDHVTPKTGLTVTMTRSLDGAAFAAATGTVTEISAGVYKVAASAADMNGDVVTHKFTGTDADQRVVVLMTTA